MDTRVLQFEVMNLSGRYIQFLSQKRQQRWVMVFLDARSEIRRLGRLVFIESLRDLAENRNKLRLLVELEAVVNVPVDLNVCKSRQEKKSNVESPTMDSQGRDSKQRSIKLDYL